MAYYGDAELGAGADAAPDDLSAIGIGRRFDDQGSAEAWLTENYLELSDLGVDQVSLFEEDRLVYGPMSLSAE